MASEASDFGDRYMNATTLLSGVTHSAEVIDLPTPNVKYVEVEIKSPGFSVFRRTIPMKGSLSVSALIDRFHDLHPEVENTVKKCGYLYPPIHWDYLHPTMDIVIEYSRSEWVRLRVVDKPTI